MKHIKKDTLLKIVFVVAAVSLIFAIGLVVGTKLIESKYQTQESTDLSESATAQQGDISITTEDLYASDDGKAVTMFDGEPYVAKENIETVLFIGADASEDRDEADIEAGNKIYNQSDVIMLIVIDHDTESYSVIQFNRDTMAEIIIAQNQDGDITKDAQLALSFAYGTDMNDCSELTVTAISKLLHDTKIDHYVTITMDAIPILNDQVGGVTVTIPEDMTMDDPAMAEGATITLTGEQADIFIRARMELDDPTNINRMSRQRTYIDAWSDIAISKMNADDDFAIDLILTLSNYLWSDMDASKLSSLADTLAGYTNEGIITINGESVEGEKYMEFYIDEADLLNVIKEEFYEPYEG